MITKSFIAKVHDAFDELGYHETRRLDFNEFQNVVAKTLTHCKELSDAIDTVRMFQFCLKEWDKIEKIFRQKLTEFNSYDYEGRALISVVNDEDACGTYYITNGINNNVKELVVASQSFEEEIFVSNFEKGRFSLYEDGDYYIKYSKMSSDKMKLFDNYGNCLCNIVLNTEYEIFLENNISPYDLVIYDDCIGVYSRDYIERLADDEVIETDEMLADIEWDILEKNSPFGVAKLNVYEEDQDLEMLLLFAASTFLAFNNFIQNEKRDSRIAMSYWATR